MSTESTESPGTPPRPQQPESVLAAVALGCGVLGLATVLFVVPQVGIVLGAFGVTAGWRGRQGNVRQRIALAGICLGAVAVVIGVVGILVNVATAPA